MMKKGVICVGLLSALLLTGCNNQSNTSKTSSSTSTAVKKVSSVKYYQKLNKADKKQLKFHFTAEKERDGFYSITAKIKNESKSSVKFNLKDMFIYKADGKKIKSARDEKLTVKAHETCSIKNLFTNISVGTLNDSTNYFIYLDPANKLSKFDFRIATGKATKEANKLEVSNTVKPTTNADLPSAVRTAKNGSSTGAGKTPGIGGGGTGSSTGSTTGSTAASNKPNAPARILTNADMARSLYLHSMNMNPEVGQSVNVIDTGSGYKIVDNSLNGTTGNTTYLTYSGDETDASGNVLANLGQLAGHTAGQPDGWVYNGINYSSY